MSLLSLGSVSAQDTGTGTTTDTDTTDTDDSGSTAADILDCSNKPCEVVCPKRSIYQAGTNCTDSCEQTVCNTTLVCGCYCQGNYKKVNGTCVREKLCKRKSPGTNGSLLSGIGGGGGLGNRPAAALGAGLGNRPGLGGRRKNIAAMMQKILEQLEANKNSQSTN